jgi:hypothetical protein
VNAFQATTCVLNGHLQAPTVSPPLNMFSCVFKSLYIHLVSGLVIYQLHTFHVTKWQYHCDGIPDNTECPWHTQGIKDH